jgi:outer membrane protein TolC
MTLEQAIALSTTSSPTLQFMQERINQAIGGRNVAFADFLPEAKTSIRPIAGDTNVNGYALPTIPTYAGNVAFGGVGDRFNLAELNLQWILWDFGRTHGKYGQAVTQVEITRLQYERARQTVAFNVTTAYFQVLQARALRVVAQEAVTRAESVVRDAENFLKRGTGIRNDLLRAQTLLAEMQLNAIKARTAEGIAVAALNQTIGINVGCLTQVVDRTQEARFTLSLAESLQLASEHREEFGVVLRAIRSAGLGAQVAQADFLPRVLVGGVAAHQDSNLVKNANLVAGGLSIELALFEGGRRVGKLQTAEADIRAAIAQGKEICDKIAFEVHSAFLLIDDARQRLVLARTIVARADENLRVVRSLFTHGDATPTEVVDAELAMTRAQQDQFTAAYDYQTALARLAYAAGLPILTDFAALEGRTHD